MNEAKGVKPKYTVAEYVKSQLALCGKSQREIAAEIEYANPNIITMFKLGTTKIPIAKIGALAKALGVDPAFLLRMAMSEYMPEAWQEIQTVMGKQNLMTEQERRLVDFINNATEGQPLDIDDQGNRKALEEVLRTIVARVRAKADAAVARLDALAPNSRHRQE